MPLTDFAEEIIKGLFFLFIFFFLPPSLKGSLSWLSGESGTAKALSRQKAGCLPGTAESPSFCAEKGSCVVAAFQNGYKPTQGFASKQHTSKIIILFSLTCSLYLSRKQIQPQILSIKWEACCYSSSCFCRDVSKNLLLADSSYYINFHLLQQQVEQI